MTLLLPRPAPPSPVRCGIQHKHSSHDLDIISSTPEQLSDLISTCSRITDKKHQHSVFQAQGPPLLLLNQPSLTQAKEKEKK